MLSTPSRFALAIVVSTIMIVSLDAFVIHHPHHGSLLHRSASAASALVSSPRLMLASQAQARENKRGGAGGLGTGAEGGVMNLACSVSSGHKKVLVVGGTGRVGGSTARWLLEFGDEEGVPVDVVLGGRSEKNYKSSLGRIGAKVRT